VIVGLIVGVAITMIQLVTTGPLIEMAEVYEAKTSDAAALTGHTHDQPHEHAHESGEGQHAWAPALGLERLASTAAANILIAMGYALILTAAIVVSGMPITVTNGLLWGGGAFLSVMFAPALGLPPELPGIPSAPLVDRQIWWLATVLCTAGALFIFAYRRQPKWLAVAAMLIMTPHVVGAPEAPADVLQNVPTSLELQFIAAALLTTLLMWCLIGVLSSVVFVKLGRAIYGSQL
jgi:cobalt transporter subunit CbtA